MDHERQAGNEFDFIDWIRRLLPDPDGDVPMGPGDDCAVVAVGEERLLLKVDSILEGVHMQFAQPDAPGFATPRQAGYKSVARALSDVAAMGGVPRFALANTTLPHGRGRAFREELLFGMLDACALFSVRLVGGDTKTWTEHSALALGITLMGDMQSVAPVYRSGGKPGDCLLVTGTLGGSLQGKHLNFTPRCAEGRWLAEFGVRCMIDLSDGISGDLRHICGGSHCGAIIDEASLPVSDDAELCSRNSGQTPHTHALHDGEDYELLFSVAQERTGALMAKWPFADTKLTSIGFLVEGREVTLRNAAGVRPMPNRGYEHEF